MNWLPAVAVTLLFFAGTWDFGPGYDELIGDFQYGERSLFFFLTGDWRYLAFEGPPPPEIQREGHADLRSFALRYSDHGEAACLVSAITCWVFFRTLDWLPAVEAHHAANWLFGLVLVGVMFRIIRRVLGLGAAAWAIVFLFAQPRVLAHFFFNIKDFPEACLFGLCVLCFWSGWTEHRAGKVLLAGFLAGVAFVVKANILFLPLVLFPWAWYHRRVATSTPQGNARRSRRWLAALALMPVAAVAGFYATWPHLWTDPTGVAWRYLNFIWGRSHSTIDSAPLAALGAWLSSTPEIILAGLVVGLVFWFRETEKQARSFLLLAALWLLVPLVRSNLPGMQHHDGIRLFLEITVPTAVLAGWGVSRLVDSLGRGASTFDPSGIGRRIVVSTVSVGLIAIALWEPVRVYPLELAYFNRASGGLAGAQRRGNPDATDYWGASYRQGIAWLNRNLPEGSVVAVPFAEHLVRYTRGAPGGLRGDVELLPISTPYDAGEVNEALYRHARGRGPVSVMFVTRKSWYNDVIRHAQARGRLVHSIHLDGAPVLQIYHVAAEAE